MVHLWKTWQLLNPCFHSSFTSYTDMEMILSWRQSDRSPAAWSNNSSLQTPEKQSKPSQEWLVDEPTGSLLTSFKKLLHVAQSAVHIFRNIREALKACVCIYIIPFSLHIPHKSQIKLLCRKLTVYSNRSVNPPYAAPWCTCQYTARSIYCGDVFACSRRAIIPSAIILVQSSTQSGSVGNQRYLMYFLPNVYWLFE